MTKSEIQRIRSLHDKPGRESLGLFLVEGPKVIGELIAAKFPLEAIYATAAWETRPAGAAVTTVTEREMSQLSQYPTPSPVLAVARIQRPDFVPSSLNRGWTLALDGIQDPGNVGTMLRIADWYGIERILLSPSCADAHSAKVIGASMGSFARVATHVVDLTAALTGTTVPILGCDLAGDSVHSLKPAKDVVIVIGSEGQGLSEPVSRLVTRRVTIPRHGPFDRLRAGAAESLNAAVAAGIVCDNLRRATYY